MMPADLSLEGEMPGRAEGGGATLCGWDVEAPPSVGCADISPLEGETGRMGHIIQGSWRGPGWRWRISPMSRR
jgi:hypothetical protein